MDQPNLLIGVGIAAAGEGRRWRSDFRQPCRNRGAPIVPRLFWGALRGNQSAKSLKIKEVIEDKGLMVDAQGIEPWTSPV